jgi:type II secretory pathway component GspD/PulD (secretin)
MKNILFLIVLFFCLSVAAQDEKEYKLISLQNVDYAIVDQICRPWLGKGGVLVHEKKRNSILVYDTPETIVKIRKFLDSTATPEVNIRIDIEKRGIQTSDSGRLTYRYNQPVKVTTYKNGKKVVNYSKHKRKNKPRLIINQRSTRGHSNSLQFIVTKSGSPASLWVGQTVVNPSWLRQVIPKHTSTIYSDSYSVTIEPPDLGSKMVNVGLALYVLPRYLGNDLIEVEVYPEISEVVGKKRKWKNIKVTSLSTKIVVKNGARVNIGGVVSQKSERYRSLFGPDFFKRKGMSETMDMYIIATVIKPGDSGRRSPFPDSYMR